MTEHEANTYATALRESGRFSSVIAESYQFGANPPHYCVGIKPAGNAPSSRGWKWLYHASDILQLLDSPGEKP